MKTSASIIFCLSIISTVLHADPQAVATRLKGDWNAETGTFHERIGGPADAASITELVNDPAVQKVHFDAVKLDLKAIQALGAAKTLKTLFIVHSNVGDIAMLRKLAKIKSLESIHVGSSAFGDEGLEALAQLSNVKTLWLTHVSRDPKRPITAKGLHFIADGMPQLETFGINLHRREDDMIPALAKMKKLKMLNAEWVSPSFLVKLRAALPNVKVQPRGDRLIPENFDPAHFDPAKDLFNEDGTPFVHKPAKGKQ